MERRDMLKTVAAAVAGAISSSAMAADHDHHHDHGGPMRNAGLVGSTADCLKAGEACLAHCIYLLGNGEKEMAACAQSVNEMMAVCAALMKLASQDSKWVPAMAKLAADTCANCEKECRKHEKKHPECKACAEACAACLKECKQLSA